MSQQHEMRKMQGKRGERVSISVEQQQVGRGGDEEEKWQQEIAGGAGSPLREGLPEGGGEVLEEALQQVPERGLVGGLVGWDVPGPLGDHVDLHGSETLLGHRTTTTHQGRITPSVELAFIVSYTV